MLGGPSNEVLVRVGAALVELSVENGRLVELTVWSASSILQDDVLFEAGLLLEDDGEGPF